MLPAITSGLSRARPRLALHLISVRTIAVPFWRFNPHRHHTWVNAHVGGSRRRDADSSEGFTRIGASIAAAAAMDLVIDSLALVGGPAVPTVSARSSLPSCAAPAARPAWIADTPVCRIERSGSRPARLSRLQSLSPKLRSICELLCATSLESAPSALWLGRRSSRQGTPSLLRRFEIEDSALRTAGLA
jgi:hypothetical protein